MGRCRFQMDLGNDLIKAGIEMDWKDLMTKSNDWRVSKSLTGFPATARSAPFVNMDSLMELHTNQKERRETHHPMLGLSVLALTKVLNHASCVWSR